MSSNRTGHGPRAMLIGATVSLLGAALLSTLPTNAAPAGAAGTSVGNVVVQALPGATGYTSSTYSITFTATHGITLGGGSGGSPPAITVQAPAGTQFSNGGASIVDNSNPNDNNSVPCSSPGPAPNILWVGLSACSITIGAGDSITVTVPRTTNPSSSGPYTLTVATNQDSTPATSSPYRIAPEGYWLVGTDGGIFTFGSAQFYGSTGNLRLNRPVVGITPTADRGGYWLDASDGGVFSFGDTSFYGSVPGLGFSPAGSGGPHSLNAPIVGMVPSVDDYGYFMVASDGGVFAFGDAQFAGSCPGIGGCVGSAVAVMPDATGQGYWLVTNVGAVYSFGDAQFLGAPGNVGSPITSAVRTPDGGGYWILDGSGQVHAYGNAAQLGNDTNGIGAFYNPANAIFTDIPGDGYGVVASHGGVTTFGGVPNYGGMQNTTLNGAIIAASGY